MLYAHPLNPFRPVHWRWECARMIREKRIKDSSHKNDEWLKHAFRFQRKLAKCKDELDRYALMELQPALYGAYLIYQKGESDDRHPMRYAIEARILADESYSSIANRLGLQAETIEAYEKIFFNVKDRLRNQDYIMTCVIGPAVYAGLSDRDYDLLWKLFAYIYGPVALDAFIHTTTSRYKPENLNEVDTVLAEDARSALQRKVAVVARTYTINPFSQSELLNIYSRFLEMEREIGGEKNRDVILQNVQVMLDKLPFKVGTDHIEQTKVLDYYDNTSVELTANELMAAAMDKDVIDPQLMQIKFPEPPQNSK